MAFVLVLWQKKNANGFVIFYKALNVAGNHRCAVWLLWLCGVTWKAQYDIVVIRCGRTVYICF